MYSVPGCTPEIILPPVIATIKLGLLYEISHLSFAMTLYDIIHSIKSLSQTETLKIAYKLMGNHFKIISQCFKVGFVFQGCLGKLQR